MLSIIGGSKFGMVCQESQHRHGVQVQLIIVKVNKKVSSFLSGLQAIITELECRSQAGNKFIYGKTVIGTVLVVQNSEFGILLQAKTASLFKRLLTEFGIVFVISVGNVLRFDPSEFVMLIFLPWHSIP